MRGLALAIMLAATTFSIPVVHADEAALNTRIQALARINFANAPTFAPDGKRIAYLSNRSGSPQVWVLDRAAGTSLQITTLGDPVTAVAWSPAGDRIAFSTAPGGGLNGQVWIMRPDGSEQRLLTPGGKEGTRLARWSHDGRGLLVSSNKDDPAAQNAALIDVVTGKWTAITTDAGQNGPGDMRGNAVTVRRTIGRGDNNLYLIDRAGGREVLLTPHQRKATNDWGEISPDGRTIYLVSNVGRDREAFGTVSVNAAGKPGPIRYFAQRGDAVAESAVLSEDGRTAALGWNAGGRVELVLRDNASGRLRKIAMPVDLGVPVAFSPDGGTLAFAGAAADRTADIYLIDVASGSVVRATESAHDGVDLATLVRPELISYAAPDGVKLSGWLYRPAGGQGRMPMVFSYHGGPEGQARPTLFADAQALAASGIAVFAPNVRGSSGFGKAFMALDDGAKRVGSVSDIKATTDALVAMGLADPKRLGIMGGSYGGYMTMAGITQYPAMFAAAANLYGIVNFASFFRETEPWMAAISTTEYGDPKTQAAMLSNLSPIHKLDRIKTPLFVLHGANDTNVPLVEARQIVESLSARGVPVKFTLFPDEGHGWRKTANRVRSTTEITAFFVEHLKPQGVRP